MELLPSASGFPARGEGRKEPRNGGGGWEPPQASSSLSPRTLPAQHVPGELSFGKVSWDVGAHPQGTQPPTPATP